MISHFLANDSISTGPCSKFEYNIDKQYLTCIILRNKDCVILTLAIAIYVNSGIQDFVFQASLRNCLDFKSCLSSEGCDTKK